MNTSLATGAKLDAATWADFVTRLRHDCQGEGVRDHCTAEALFTVQRKKFIYGVDKDFTDKWCVTCDGSDWKSPKEYWEGCYEDERLNLNALAQAEYEHDFLELNESEQWDLLGELPGHTVMGWDEGWEYVNSHFTKDAAEAFIRRKKHDYPDGIRVYVEAQIYCWEFNEIKEAIMAGKLIYKDGAAS